MRWRWAVMGSAVGMALGCGEVPGVPVGRSGKAGPVLARNVILISLDTLRADRLEPYGYTRETSPNLAGLARRSVVFTKAQAQSSQTAPSHASLFTSVYAGAHGVINVHGGAARAEKLPPRVRTLAEAVQGSGVDTAAFVSGGNLTRHMDMDRGFDVWDERNEDVGGRVDALLRWVDGRNGRRFFVVLHTYQVHAPYLPPLEWVRRFVRRGYEGPLRERLERYLDLDPDQAWAGAVGPDYWEGMLEFTSEDVAFLSDLYDAEIGYTDGRLRELLESVLTSRLSKDTAVVVLSDHGEEFQDHGKFQHDQVFEELVRVPLMIRAPTPLEREGWKGLVDVPVELVDVAPTIAELMGVDWSEFGWEGRSLVELMRPGGHAAETWRNRPRFSELVVDPGPKFYRSVTLDGWKYIHAWQANIDKTWEWLFHLDADPGERQNLMEIGGPVAKRMVGRLRKLLGEFAARNARKRESLGSAGSAELDEEAREALEQLGYAR